MQEIKKTTRGRFIKNLILSSAAIAFPVIDHTKRKNLKDSHITPKSVPFLKIAAETIALQLGCVALSTVLHKCGIRTGNVALQNPPRLTEVEKLKLEFLLQHNPKAVYKALYLSMAVIAPAIEEGFLRALPSIFANPTKTDWTVGTISSLVFGYLHNITNEQGSLGFDTKSVPSGQIIIGFFYWHLHRTYGFTANTFGHCFNNAIGVRLITSMLRKERVRIVSAKSNIYTRKIGPVLGEKSTLYAVSPILKKKL